jgi:glycosyltransferase involved in cell wall biosynthesis
MTVGMPRERTTTTNRPKVLRAIARLNIGGPARHAIILDEGLRARGFECLLVHGSPSPEEGSFEALLDEHSVRSIRIHGLGRRVHVWSDLVAFWRFVRILLREKPDIVHTHTAKAGALGRTAAVVVNFIRPAARRSLLLHTYHGNVMSGYFGVLASKVVRGIERTLASWTDCVITISERQRDEIVDRFRIVDRARVSVVPLGLELNDLLARESPDRSLRQTLGWTEEHVVVGYVGRFVPIKDVDTLIAGFARFASREPRGRLLLVGDGELRASLEAQVRSLGLDGAVRFVGWRRDLAQVYGAMDVVGLTSRNEGTPVSLIEALAAGLPVVATAVGGVPDVIRQGETGLLIPPGNPAAFAAALDQIVSDADLRQRMSARGRSEVEQRFGRERLVAEVAALYFRLLRRRESGANWVPSPQDPAGDISRRH